MRTSIDLRCQCGAVRGTLTEASPRTVNRVICYCDDCQKFAEYLERHDLLDNAGGSDIIQVAANRVGFHQGAEHICGVRLTDDGTYRWYSECCKTPLGNMAGLNMPAIGVHVAAFPLSAASLDAQFGLPSGGIWGEFAKGDARPNSKGLPAGVILRALPKVLFWKLTGKARPNPFIEPDGTALRYPVKIVAQRT